MDNRVTIIMTSCKWYDDILDIHEKLHDLHWKDCPYKRILVMDEATENADYLNKYDEVLITGKETGKRNHVRIQEALKKVTTPYVIFLQEDMLLFDKVDTAKIERLVDEMEKNDKIGFIRLIPYSAVEMKYAVDYDSSRNLVEYTKDTPFRISYAPSVWRTDFLTELSAQFEFGADFEREGTERTRDSEYLMLGYKYSAYPYINAIRRGKWENFAVSQVQYYDIDIDFSKHPVMSTKDNLKQAVINYIYSLNPNKVVQSQNKSKRAKKY